MRQLLWWWWLLMVTSNTVNAVSAQCQQYIDRSKRGVTVLMDMYNHTNGQWTDNSTEFGNWWNTANMLNTIANYVELVPSELPRFLPIFENSFYRAQEYALIEKAQWTNLMQLYQKPLVPIRNGFTRMYFDDDGWWALMWLKVFDLTGNDKFLTATEMIFEHMASGWSAQCGGGIWWNTEYNYKNTIANQLFLHVAASLARRVEPHKVPYYRIWAEKEYSWLVTAGLINSDYLFNDGLDETCRNNQETTWSYNQGVILGALVEMDKLFPASHALYLANKVALSAIRHLSDEHGVLHDDCEPDCWKDNDSPQFKGVFIRHLATLDRITPNARYKDYIMANAEAVWTRNRNRHDEFGDVWSGPPTSISPQTHSSALDALVASVEKGCNIRL